MYAVKALIDACMSIFSIEMYLFGYHITLFQVFIFTAVGFLAMWFIFRILR